jgi:hypothetical protein
MRGRGSHVRVPRVPIRGRAGPPLVRRLCAGEPMRVAAASTWHVARAVYGLCSQYLLGDDGRT